MHLIADDVAFSYPGRPVLEHATVRVSGGVRLGIVGENGSGKSTLLRILAGELHPSAGAVRRQGTLTSVAQELTAVPGQTVGDLIDEALSHVREVAAELDAAIRTLDSDTTMAQLGPYSRLLARADHLAAWDVDQRVDVALTRLGAHRHRSRRLDTLSVGERYRVRLACRLAERSDLLLLDEPTNHLDDSAIGFLTGELRTWNGGVVIVTHDRRLLDDVATAILDLGPSIDGRPTLYGQGGYSAYRAAKDAALARWRRRYDAECKRAARLEAQRDEAYEGLSDEWRPEKGSQKNRRATRARVHVKAADRLVEKLAAEAVDVPVPPMTLEFPDLPVLPPGSDGGHPLIELRGPRVLGGARTTAAMRLDLRGTRIAIPASGRLLVTGRNGAGKSTLLQALAGTVLLDAGVRTVAPGVRLGLVAQDTSERESAYGKATGFDECAREAMRLLARGALDPEHVVPVAYLGLLADEDLERPLVELSTGQRRRFEFARALVAAPHILIVDEPTNHLSIDLVDALTVVLRGTSAAVVIATHDRRMRADLADWPTLDLG